MLCMGEFIMLQRKDICTIFLVIYAAVNELECLGDGSGENLEGAVDKALRNPGNTSGPWKVTAGEASFLGLADGTYYLAETKAPSGYNKLKNPVTDGPGILWFTLIGLLLVGIALLTYSMSKEEKERNT